MGDVLRLALLVKLEVATSFILFLVRCGLKVGAAFRSQCKAGPGFDEAVKL